MQTHHGGYQATNLQAAAVFLQCVLLFGVHIVMFVQQARMDMSSSDFIFATLKCVSILTYLECSPPPCDSCVWSADSWNQVQTGSLFYMCVLGWWLIHGNFDSLQTSSTQNFWIHTTFFIVWDESLQLYSWLMHDGLFDARVKWFTSSYPHQLYTSLESVGLKEWHFGIALKVCMKCQGTDVKASDILSWLNTIHICMSAIQRRGHSSHRQPYE